MEESTPPAWEFYDLQMDPSELHNAYRDPQYETIIKGLKEELVSWRQNVGDTDENFPDLKSIIEDYWE